jgi:hypothetical protein
MKNLFLIFLTLISTLASAQSNRQRLDDIEFELQKLKIERDGREFDRQMDELRRLREKNRDSPYMVLSDGTVINVDEHIRNRKNICYLTWTGNQFIKGLPSYKNYIEIHFNTIPNIIFIPKSNEKEFANIIDKNKNVMEKICPNLKTNSEFLSWFK